MPLHSKQGYLDGIALAGRTCAWLAGGEGLIYHTSDAGNTWTIDDRLYERPGYPIIRNIFFHDSLHGWIGYDGFGTRKIARTTDGGENWEIVNSEGSRLRQALNKDVAFAEMSWAANISRTTDAGVTWQQIFPGIQNQPASAWVSFISESEGWATIKWGYGDNYGSLLIHTQDGGASWDTLLNWPGRSLFDICMLPSREGWILGSQSGGLLHTTDGINWSDDPLPDIGDRPLHSLFVLPGPHAWVVAGDVLGGLVLSRMGD